MNTIFIFYDNPKNATFQIENNKEYKWEWIGSGGNAHPLYPYEMQFMGPPENCLDFKEYLDIQLNKFKQEGKIIRYYLAHQYSEIDNI